MSEQEVSQRVLVDCSACKVPNLISRSTCLNCGEGLPAQDLLDARIAEEVADVISEPLTPEMRLELDEALKNARTRQAWVRSLRWLPLAVMLAGVAYVRLTSADRLPTGTSLIYFVTWIAAVLLSYNPVFAKYAKQLSDVQYLGYLAEVSYSPPNKKDSVLATSILGKILPDVKPEHERFLDPYQRYCLYELLKRQDGWHQFLGYNAGDIAFTRGLLHAIHQIGGREAIPYLESFQTWAKRQKKEELRQLGEYATIALVDVRLRTAKRIIESRVALMDGQRKNAEFHVDHMHASLQKPTDQPVTLGQAE